MAKKKTKKKTARKKSKPLKKAKIAKNATAKKAAPQKRKLVLAKRTVAKKLAPVKRSANKPRKRRIRGQADSAQLVAYENTGRGARTGGQSGDTQGLSGVADAESESVKELLEEGQSYEAEIVEGVESAPDADEGEVRTHEVPEDDVPNQYLGKDAEN